MQHNATFLHLLSSHSSSSGSVSNNGGEYSLESFIKHELNTPNGIILTWFIVPLSIFSSSNISWSTVQDLAPIVSVGVT